MSIILKKLYLHYLKSVLEKDKTGITILQSLNIVKLFVIRYIFKLRINKHIPCL